MGKTLNIVIGVVVGIVVVVAVVVPCVLLIPSSSSSSSNEDNRPSVGFDEYRSSKYDPKSIYPNWDKSTEDTSDFITTDSGAVVRRKIDAPYTNVGDPIIASDAATILDASFYSMSADGAYAAYRTDYVKVWRHSYTATYKIWDVVNKKEVTTPKLPGEIQHFEWAPVGHSLAIVQGFTVHMIEDIAAVGASLLQVSPTGAKNMDYYGIPDWMYEEEMISSKSALYWSPSATRLAYLHTNEEGVNLIEYTWYGDGQYPQTIEIAYPKANTKIGKATLWVYNILNDTDEVLQAPADWVNSKADHYFSRFTWKDEDTCLATWTNRMQTTSVGQFCAKNATDQFECSNKAASTEVITGGWVGSFGPFYPVWKKDSEGDYFTIYTRDNAAKDDGYWQIAYVSKNEINYAWMTNTAYDIVGLNFYDERSQHLYFTAAHNEPRRRHILRVPATDRNIAEPKCMTCDLLSDYQDRCGWITPRFNQDGSKIVLNCRGPLIPLTIVINIAADGTWDYANRNVIENNDDLASNVEAVKWPVREFSTFQSDQYPKAYQYEIWRPADFDPTKKYPLLIHVYAGPEFQKVTETWTSAFTQIYMPSTRDVIVASVDGRGSAYEGYKFMRQTYHKLGQLEAIDQTDFAKYLISTYDYIDANHVAMWGWSYGGYATSHALGHDNGATFQCGIAVAPLADWTWYDAMYAERYMGDLDDNADGYEKASIIRGHDINNFKNSKYTLIHGTADDNVHFQSAAEMEKALVKADVDFDNFFYADEAHSINTEPNANRHIYHQVDIRLSHCLGKVEQPYGGPRA